MSGSLNFERAPIRRIDSNAVVLPWSLRSEADDAARFHVERKSGPSVRRTETRLVGDFDGRALQDPGYVAAWLAGALDPSLPGLF